MTSHKTVHFCKHTTYTIHELVKSEHPDEKRHLTGVSGCQKCAGHYVGLV